ncbi:MAG: TolC family protein [Gammaproteobacteria bacterium]
MNNTYPLKRINLIFKILLLAPVIVALLAGCTHVPRDGDFSEVERLVGERIPQKVHWYQGGEEDAQVKAALDDLLKEPLTATSAVQIALLNNRSLQSEYENLGIAQADLVQAGLLSNPVLFASIRFPNGGDGSNNTEFNIAKEFLDVLLRPARKRIAETEFERAKLRVSNAVLDLAAEVQSAFYNVQGNHQLVDIQNVATDAAQASYELAQRFDEAGNISELELAQERSAAADMSAELLRARANLQGSRDALNKLLGLTGAGRHWSLGHRLPELPDSDPDQEHVEEVALNQRLDLAAAKKEISQLSEALEITRKYRWIGGATFGVSTERDPEGNRVTGPIFSVEIPVFDQRQAEIARLESLLEQSKFRWAALEVAIQNDVRAAVHRISAARNLSEYYRDELVPAREQVVKFTQQEQNYMLVDVFELLFARQQEIQTYHGYIDSLAEYWIGRADLARIIGVGLPEVGNMPIVKSKETQGHEAMEVNSKEHDTHLNNGDAMQH